MRSALDSRALTSNPDNEYNDEDLFDLSLAIGLLTGAWTQQGLDPAKRDADRYPAKRYFSAGLEKQAREAIGRLLRSKKPLDSTLRCQLAELFDGFEPYSSFDGQPVARRIAFEFRRAGIPNETKLRNLHLVSDYRALLLEGVPRKRAVGRMCKKYGVSETLVKEACRTNPKLLPRTIKKRVNRPT
jgi:hypothetical protein